MRHGIAERNERNHVLGAVFQFGRRILHDVIDLRSAQQVDAAPDHQVVDFPFHRGLHIHITLPVYHRPSVLRDVDKLEIGRGDPQIRRNVGEIRNVHFAVDRQRFFIRGDDPVTRKTHPAAVDHNFFRSQPESRTDHRHLHLCSGEVKRPVDLGFCGSSGQGQFALQRTGKTHGVWRQERIGRSERQAGNRHGQSERILRIPAAVHAVHAQRFGAVQREFRGELLLSLFSLSVTEGQLGVSDPLVFIPQFGQRNGAVRSDRTAADAQRQIRSERPAEGRGPEEQFQRRCDVDPGDMQRYGPRLRSGIRPNGELLSVARQRKIGEQFPVQPVSDVIVRIDLPTVETEHRIFEHPHGDRTVFERRLQPEIEPAFPLPIFLQEFYQRHVIQDIAVNGDHRRVVHPSGIVRHPQQVIQLPSPLHHAERQRIQQQIARREPVDAQPGRKRRAVAGRDVQRHPGKTHAPHLQKAVHDIVRAGAAGQPERRQLPCDQLHIETPQPKLLRNQRNRTPRLLRQRIDRNRSCEIEPEIARLHRRRYLFGSYFRRNRRFANTVFAPFVPQHDLVGGRFDPARPGRIGRNGQIEGHGYRRLFRRKVHPVQVAGIDRTPHRYGLLRLRQQAFDIQSEFQRLALAGQTAYQTVIPQRSIQRDAAVIVTSVNKTVDPHGGFGYGRCMQRIETRTVGRHPHRQYAQRIVRQKTVDRETVADQFCVIKLLFTVEFPLYGRRSRTYRKRRYRIKRSLPHPQRTFQRHLFRNPEPAAQRGVGQQIRQKLQSAETSLETAQPFDAGRIGRRSDVGIQGKQHVPGNRDPAVCAQASEGSREIAGQFERTRRQHLSYILIRNGQDRL